MADDTSAALIAQLDVKFDALASNMKKAMTVFDNGGRALEKRQKEIKKNLSNWALDFSGLGGLNKELVGLTAGAIVGGIGALVKKSLDAASAIGDVAQQAGVGVEFLQKIRFAASQSGASFDIMDTALTTLNKSLGDFVQTGAGKGAAAFKALGIDKLINSGQVRNAEQAFDAISKGLSKFGSEAQKSSILAGVFGKEAGPKLLQLMNSGADGIAKLEAQAVSLGIVLSTQTVAGAKDANDKLDALFSVIKAQGVAAVASLAPEIAHLAQEITNGLPDLITWVEQWAAWFGLIKLSPAQKLAGEIKDAKDNLDDLVSARNQTTGIRGFFNKFLPTNGLDAQIAKAKAKLDGLQSQKAVLTPFAGPYNLPAPPAKLSVAQTPAEIALAAKRKELLAQTSVDAATAQAALLVAQDQTNTQLLKGSADYYAAVQKQINDEYQAKVTTAEAEAAKQKATLGKQGTDWKGYATGVANINSELNDKIAAADEERKQKQFENGPGALIQQSMEQAREIVQQYTDETAALGLTAAAAAKLSFVQQQLAAAREKQIPITSDLIAAWNAEGDAVGKAAQANYDANQKMQANIQVADNVRDGLVDIGTTALTQAGSFKEAVGQMLLSLAQLIVKLELTKIAQDALGQSGTPLPGILGGLFGSSSLAANTNAAIAANPLLFAKGGVMTPSGPQQLRRYAGGGTSNQAAIFGEAGPEAAVPLPDGRRIPVELRIPSVPQINAMPSTAPVIVQQFDLSGAVVTDAIMARAMQAGDAAAAARIKHYDSKVLPTRVASLRQQPRVR